MRPCGVMSPMNGQYGEQRRTATHCNTHCDTHGNTHCNTRGPLVMTTTTATRVITTSTQLWAPFPAAPLLIGAKIPFLKAVASCKHFQNTGILYLARRSKYFLSIWPLSRGVLIPRLDEFMFFVVFQFLLQVLSPSFAPLPPFLHFSSFFPHPGRGIFPSFPGFTTHACFLQRC